VVVAYTAAEIDRCLDAAFFQKPALEAGSSRSCCIVGFDTEYRPTFQKDVPLRRTALVQLATADAVVLAHVASLQQLPPRLRALVEDPAVWKVGTGVGADLDKLGADFSVRPASFVDLGVVAKLYGHPRSGMKAMTQHFGAALDKGKSTQLSNWESAPLHAKQVSYAAEDAALGLWLLAKLHGAHGGGVSLLDWASAFLDARSADELVARPAAAHGPLRAAVAAYSAAAAAALSARNTLRLDRRVQAALQAGLAHPTQAVSSLVELAAARKQKLVWLDVVRQAQGKGVVESTCVFAGERVAQATGPSRKAARRDAATAALQHLQAQLGAGGAPGESSAPQLII